MPPTSAFRLLVVPGVIVDRWARTWSERLPDVRLEFVPVEAAQAPDLLSADADAGLVRLPVDPDAFHAIPLYTEVTVVVVPRDHLFAAADELTLAELVGEAVLRPLDDVFDWAGVPLTAAKDRPATTADAVELVAAGVGLLVTPQSLARQHQRRDLVYRPLTDGPTSSVGLAWDRGRHTDLVETMIGVVRGRTANSTRGQAPAPPAAKTRPAPRSVPKRAPKKAPKPPRRGR